MPTKKITRFRCAECPFRFTYREAVPKKVPGAFLKSGGVYCKGGKKVRGFKKKDPKVYPPSWCPRQKSPVEYSIYTYKDSNAWLLYHLLQADGAAYSPCGFEFALRTEGQIDFSAGAFQDEIERRSPSDVLGVPECCGEVIEIDDGLKPYFFHVTEMCVKPLYSFNKDAARENQYRGENGL